MTTDDQPPVDPAQAQPKPPEESSADNATAAAAEAPASQDAPAAEAADAPAADAPAVDSATEPAAAPATEPATEAPAAPAAESPSDDAPPVEAPAPSADAAPAPAPAAEAAPTEAPAAEAPAAPETQSASADAAPAAADQSAAPAPAVPVAEASARVKEKLTSHDDDRAVGSADGGKPRQERSQGGPPVEIPSDTELDSALEAQISAAMTSDTSAPVDAAPVAGVEATEGETAAPVEELGPGSQLQGVVQQVHGESVFVDAGVRSGIVVPIRQFPEGKQPSVGDKLTVIIDSVDEDGLFKARIPQGRHKAGGNWDALSVGQVVDCMVTATNKGGLQVSVSNLKGFMPASQVDLGYVADLEAYVGQKLTAQITEVNKKKRNLVVSRRILLQAERASQQGDFWAALEVGQEHEGVVKTIKDYGAFVNLGPMDGFLHIGEMAWSRINHPNEVVSEGQTVHVKILKLDAERQRISLGMKQLIQNPWLSAVERYAPERIVPGKVTRLADFGAFVELEPGIEGLVHISELAWRRVGSVGEVLSTGETRDFQIIDVDPKRKRISLSVKALEKRPDEPAAEERRPAQTRKPNTNLRGGTSSEKGGAGLFGNPSDFT